VSEAAEQAPAGWYDDPHAPGRMRYFDGAAWTDHFHEPGKLPDIGSWFSTTFATLRNHWKGAAVIAFATSIVGNLLSWLGLRSIAGDIGVINEEFVNYEAAQAVGVGLLFLAGFLVQGFGWLALSRYMHRAHFSASPTIGDALSRAVARMPKLIGLYLVAALIVTLGTMLIIAITVAVPPIGVLLMLALLPFSVWALVKLTFIAPALACAGKDDSVVQASAGVSRGRFWPVLGRVLILTIGLGIAASMLSSGLGPYGSAIDPDQLANIFQIEDDGDLLINDFQVRDLFQSTGKLLIATVLSSVVGAISALISTSGFVRLYLDSGAPSEL